MFFLLFLHYLNLLYKTVTVRFSDLSPLELSSSPSGRTAGLMHPFSIMSGSLYIHTKLGTLSYDWISVLLDHSRWHIHPTDGLSTQAQFCQICHSTQQRICSSFMVFLFSLWAVGGQTVTNLAKSLLVKVQTIESLLKNWNWQSEFEDSSSCGSSSRPQAHFSILSSPGHRANTTY